MARLSDGFVDITFKGLTPEALMRSSWQFSHENGPVDGPALQFAADGTIRNYNHPNERRWRVEDGILCLAKEDKTVTVRFNRIERRDERIFLSGRHIPNPAITLCLTELPPGWRQRPGTKIDLADQIRDFGWSVGDHTYGHPRFVEPGLAGFTVGKYTSMASGLIIALGNHRMDTVSTYPFSTLRHYWPSVPEGVLDHDTKGDVTIGNDVWIGSDVFICSGVTIGDGAVIGAKSVVTRDVPPYAVLAGNPGRVIRSRFSERQVAMLLEMQWWNWPDEVVDSFLPLMVSGDIDRFLAAAYRTARTSKGSGTPKIINDDPSWPGDRTRAISG